MRDTAPLRALLGCCAGFTQGCTDPQVERYLHEHRHGDTFYSGMQHLAPHDVVQHRQLRDEIERYIDGRSSRRTSPRCSSSDPLVGPPGDPRPALHRAAPVMRAAQPARVPQSNVGATAWEHELGQPGPSNSAHTTQSDFAGTRMQVLQYPVRNPRLCAAWSAARLAGVSGQNEP
jgi:hypothetical protein